jgi:hypothetical protein
MAWKLLSTHSSKENAEKKSKRYHKGGYHVKVVKRKSGFSVLASRRLPIKGK